MNEDADGFHLYFCGECGKTKIAALFLPAEINKVAPVCRACCGELTIRTRKARKSDMSFKRSLQQRVAYRNAI